MLNKIRQKWEQIGCTQNTGSAGYRQTIVTAGLVMAGAVPPVVAFRRSQPQTHANYKSAARTRAQAETAARLCFLMTGDEQPEIGCGSFRATVEGCQPGWRDAQTIGNEDDLIDQGRFENSDLLPAAGGYRGR